MADDTKKQLETPLWSIANTLRGKMGADEFRHYILGFIFYKYLSARIHLFASLRGSMDRALVFVSFGVFCGLWFRGDPPETLKNKLV